MVNQVRILLLEDDTNLGLIVEESSYLELSKSLGIKDLWKQIASTLHSSLPEHTEDEIATLLHERETDGSTAIPQMILTSTQQPVA